VVMTHSHALDYAITEAALRRGDLAYVGLIGSRTKRRRFERWFAARDGSAVALARLVCPIGDCGVADKRPQVIAALTAAELLRVLSRPGADAVRQDESWEAAL
ncbi:MAG: xanthine dehydrogenase accessory protein XdhC, partial [Hyphomicrobiales bacterium]